MTAPPGAVDGSKITKTGFAYEVAAPSDANIRETIAYFEALNFFPQGLLK